MTTARSVHVPALDGLRGIAILAVLAYHGWAYTGPGLGHLVARLTGIGWAGVDLFFVLSGFLITGILLTSRDDPRYWRTFLVRRGVRIFPLYYAVLLMVTIGGFVMGRLGMDSAGPSVRVIPHIWINFLYMTNFAIAIVGENYVPMDIAWSLAIEEQFYLVYPAIVRALRPVSLARVLVCVMLAAPVLRLLTWRFGPQPALGPYVLPYCRMDSLAAGALARVAMELGETRALAILARLAPVLGVIAVTLLLTLTRRDALFVVFGYTVNSLAAVALLARLTTTPAPLMKRIFENRALVYLGKISYGIYLFHLIARVVVTQIISRLVGPMNLASSWFCAAQLLGMSGLAIVISTMSFYGFERRVLAFKDRLAPSSAARSIASPGA